MPSLFAKIIQGEIPCHKIMEDDEHLAFLDIKPINPGHTLVIPKTEGDYIFDMDDEALASLVKFAKKVALKIEKTIDCQRIGVMVAGLEVPHIHIHLVPINTVHDLNFSLAKETGNEELARVASKIISG